MGMSWLARVSRTAGAASVLLVIAMPVGAMAATTVDVTGDTLTAQGDAANDVITVGRSGASFTVTGAGVTAGSGCSGPSGNVSCPVTNIIAIDLLGGAGNDTLTVDPTVELGADASLNGELGNDTLKGGLGDDEFVDSDGDDNYNGGGGSDIFLDAAGNDTYAGGTDEGRFQSTDTVDFGRGAPGVNVTLDGVANDGPGGASNNVGSDVEGVIGTPGNDTLTGGTGPDDLDGAGGNDAVSGGPGNDFLAGGPGNDTLVGGAGDDEIDDSEGNDDMSGGEGDDTAIITQALAVTISLDDAANDGGPGDAKNVRSDIENVTTGPGSDKIIGSAVVNRIDAGAGDDQIDGLGGADTLKGGAGNDTIAATDGGVDVLLCGTETDTANGDTIGGVGASVTRKAFRRGLKLKVTTNEAATVVAELLATVRPSGSIPFAAAVGDVTIGSGTLGLRSGPRTLTLKPSKKFARRVRNKRLRLTIRLTVTDRAGNVTVATKRVRVR
jgi:Ca2+-binding RTX toxin-like protein